MAVSLAAALVVQERVVWGVHLFLDDAFLGYVAWLARRAETRARTEGSSLEPPAGPEPPEAPAPGAEAPGAEGEDTEVTDARA
jgi:hypothetical protein